MATAIFFDKQIWLDRAAKRARTALTKGCPSQLVNQALAIDTQAIDDLENLIAWLQAREVNVSFTRSRCGGQFTMVGPFPKIQVTNNFLPRNQLYILLHEVGHWMVPKRLKARYANGYAKSSNPHQTSRVVHRVDVLDEELEAWWRGRALALKLGLKSFNEDAYAAFKAKRIVSYAQWLVKSGPWSAGKRIAEPSKVVNVNPILPVSSPQPVQVVSDLDSTQSTDAVDA
jgi:hypothetical protein